jgi:hypothetical protein
VYINVPRMEVREHRRSGLFFYSPPGRGIQDIKVLRARDIANILLFISPLLECSPVPSPGPSHNMVCNLALVNIFSILHCNFL